MSFLCLAGIYNHEQHWIENLVQTMIDQDYEDDIHVVVIDDRKNGFPAQSFMAANNKGYDRRIDVLPMPTRAANLLDKYQFGLDFADQNADPFGGVCVIDDDDIYLPDHISQHADVLRNSMWSYPKQVFSTYMQQFRVEDSGGRFWASSAYRRTALQGIGNYPTVCRDVLDPAFDQLFLHRMQVAYGEAGHQESPTYIYMWDMTQDNHSSGHIENGVWKYGEIPESPATGPLVPRYSKKAFVVHEMANVFRGH